MIDNKLFTFQQIYEAYRKLKSYIYYDNTSLFIRKEFSSFESSILAGCLLYTSPSPRDVEESRMPSSA